MSGSTQLSCASCGASLHDGDMFCEQCGARCGEEPARPGCRACGAGPEQIGPDGYCTVCGVRERPPGSHTELDLSRAAAVTDQGLVHRRNEDAFHLELVGEGAGAAVVCDGISSASAGDAAARRAAATAGELLVGAISQRDADAQDAMLAAIAAARAAVEATPWTTRLDREMPSCTLVSAVWRGDEIIVGWIGDSRAYWLSADGATQLTVDDSWAQEQISAGRLTAEQAAGDPRFHSITNWVGADAPERPPRLASLRADRAGRLILCTDGLWNYLSSPADLAGLVDALSDGAAPAAVARALTEVALERGGRDNITVVVVDIDPA